MPRPDEIVTFNSLREYIDNLAEGAWHVAVLEHHRKADVALLVCYALQQAGIRPDDEIPHEAIDALLAASPPRFVNRDMFVQRWRYVALRLWSLYWFGDSPW